MTPAEAEQIIVEGFGQDAELVAIRLDPDRAVVALRNIQAELERVKDLL